jgi:usherin
LPSGSIILEAEAAGPNQIQLKWFSEQRDPLVPNGEIIFAVFVTGPYLIEFDNLDELQEAIKSKKPFLLIETLNLLNTSVYNTKYGIFDRILPYSTYMVQVNASNSKGFLLSNQVKVETFKSVPDLVISPQLIDSNSTSLKIEWYNPILINSEDRTIFFQVDYKTKYLWNSNGTILEPTYEKEIKTLFQNKTLATTYTLTNLTPSSAYSFQLIASNTYGQSKSEWSIEYLTKEERPKFQDPPSILNFTSKSVYIAWKSPLKPNGRILFHRIIVYEFLNKSHIGDKQLELVQNITVPDNATKEYNVTQLESYTLYVFIIESCNSYDCVSSELYGKTKSFTFEGKAFIRTDPSEPELFEKPKLSSSNSYSINIAWTRPLKPNGEISNFLLERFDYSLPLNIKLNTTTNRPTNQTIKYRFEPNIFSFVDYENLEACGLYSYRVFAFNQIGNISTAWVNVTVALSKPLIVTSPIVNFIDSHTARFEWMKPLTYCDIKTYTLRFRSEFGVAFDVDVDNSNVTTQSIIVNDLIPFTVYDLNLIGCVNLEKDGCTQSLVRKFQTNGDIPKGLSVPVARLISYKTISIEWLEPIFKNGNVFQNNLSQVSKLLHRGSNFVKRGVVFKKLNYKVKIKFLLMEIYLWKTISKLVAGTTLVFKLFLKVVR